MSHYPLEYVRHILDEIKYIEGAGAGIDEADFLGDETLKRSFVRSLEIVGEAAKKLPTDFKDKYPDVEWRRIAGMRDRLIHGYFGVDYHIVWDIASNKLPVLKQKLMRIIDSQEPG